jgi:hypothetical protein
MAGQVAVLLVRRERRLGCRTADRNFERGFVKVYRTVYRTPQPGRAPVFARSVRTQRTMGDPGGRAGPCRRAGAAIGNPDRAGLAPDIAGRTHPGRQRGNGDTAGRAFSAS